MRFRRAKSDRRPSFPVPHSSRHSKRGSFLHRRPLFEALELRRLLAGDLQLVSGVDSSAVNGPVGLEGRFDGSGSISDNGRYVVFESGTSEIVPGDNNHASDVFLRDFVTGRVTLISRNSSGAGAGNGNSFGARISGDGSKILFSSSATDLVSGLTDSNAESDLFLYDVAGGTLTLVSKSTNSNQAANGESREARISDDGSKIVFRSLATDLVSGATDGNGKFDVFLFDVTSETLTLISESTTPNHTANGESGEGQISGNGSKIVFSSRATDLIGGVADGSTRTDIFLYDIAGGVLTLVSQSTTPNQTANSNSNAPQISDDGSKIVFTSLATDLVSGVTDLNNVEFIIGSDVFLFDVPSEAITLISRSTTANQTGDLISSDPQISGDGSKIVFYSFATNLVSGVTDDNDTSDIFLYDVAGGTLRLVSESTTPNQTGNRESLRALLSDDGAKIVFMGTATDLVGGTADGNGNMSFDVFLYDVPNGALTLVSQSTTPNQTGNGNSTGAQVSGDGGKVVFWSSATDLVSGVTVGDVVPVAFDIAMGTREFIVKRDAPPFEKIAVSGSSVAGQGAISDDGRYLVFDSTANGLVFNDANGQRDVFLRDLVTGAVTLVSRNFAGTGSGNGPSMNPQISGDGNKIVFESNATDLVSGVADSNSTSDVFLYDVAAGTLTLVSHSSIPNQTGNGSSTEARISDDGSKIVFSSHSTDLVNGVTDSNGGDDIFLYDSAAGTLSLVSKNTVSNQTGNGSCFDVQISGNGSKIVFSSRATDLVSGVMDANNFSADVFLYDVAGGTLAVVSQSTTPNQTGNGLSRKAQISGDGSTIVFHSSATNLVSGMADGNGNFDVFLYDVAVGTINLVSKSSIFNRTGNKYSAEPQISDDGNKIVFYSLASDLVSGATDDNDAFDVFLYDVAAGTLTVVSQSITPGESSYVSDISDNGSKVVLRSNSSDLDGVMDGNGQEDIFLYDALAGTLTLLSESTTANQTANRGAHTAQISGYGSTIVFLSESNDLVSEVLDGANTIDVFAAVFPLELADAPNLTVAADSTGNEDAVIALSIAASLVDIDGSETLSVTIGGVPTGATLSAGTDLGGGVWRLAAAELAGLTITPPANSDVDFTLTVTARATESSSGLTAETAATIDVHVDAVADEANLAASGTTGVENTKLPLSIAASLTDTDGSETLSIRISGVPVGAAFWNGNTQVGSETSPGSGVWQFATSQLPALSILPPINQDADFELTVAAITAEAANGDQEQTTQTIDVIVTLVYQPEEILVVGANAGTRPRVKLIDIDDGSVVASFLAYSSAFTGGVRVAIADLNGDGEAEIIVAPGAGMSTLVKVFTIGGDELVAYRTKAYTGFSGGVFVAAGDVNGDGRVDIITSPGQGLGLGANIKVFKNRVGIASSNPDPISDNPIHSFLAFNTQNLGATVAAGDFTGDGKAEIVVGNGVGMGPRVRVFDLTAFTSTPQSPLRLGTPVLETRPFDSTDRNGVFVAVGNVRGDGRPEIIVGNGAYGRSRVEMYDAAGSRFKSLTAYATGEGRNAPVHVAAKNVDLDLFDEVITGQGNPGSFGQLRSFNSDASLVDDVFEGEDDFQFGFFVA
jgi:hypothetical protein